MQGLVHHSKVRKKPTHCLEEDIEKERRMDRLIPLGCETQ